MLTFYHEKFLTITEPVDDTPRRSRYYMSTHSALPKHETPAHKPQRDSGPPYRGELRASWLRLPARGPFVVMAAEVPAVGSEALPKIESMLRGLDVYSAWRLQPDLQVGIVHVKSERQLDEILGLVSRLATDRVGVSSCFDDLRDTPQALYFAKVMQRGRPHHSSPVAVFDGSILATAAVAAPEVVLKSILNALRGFEDLPEDERETLCETFRVWQDNDASVRRTAEVLFCHPNTVRHRLRRIEKHSGRSLSRPKDLAELCLASEVHRRLM